MIYNFVLITWTRRRSEKDGMQMTQLNPKIRTAGAYTFGAKAEAFMRAAARGRNPVYAVAEEGIFGGFDIPERLELEYVNRISSGCERKGSPDSKMMGRLIDKYLFSGIEYRRVLKSLTLGGEFDKNSPSFMRSNYVELAKSVDENPGLFSSKRAECFLGRIAGYARGILELGIPMPEEQAQALRMILSAHAKRFGVEGKKEPEREDEGLEWTVIPYTRGEYTIARRTQVFLGALLRMQDPLMEVAKEGFFGEYALDGRTRIMYYCRISDGFPVDEGGSEDFGQLLFSVQSYETLYAFKRMNPTPIGDGMSTLVLQMAAALERNESVLGPRLCAALRRKIAGLAENIMHEADAVPGGSDERGDMALARIISEIGCRR